MATLEAAALHLTTVTEQQPKVKTQRRRPEKREILYARLKIQEGAINQLLTEKEELEQKVTRQEQTIKDLQASIKKLEADQKRKRGRMEL